MIPDIRHLSYRDQLAYLEIITLCEPRIRYQLISVFLIHISAH